MVFHEKFCKWASQTKLKLNKNSHKRAENALIDTLACILSGINEKQSKTALKFTIENSEKGNIKILGVSILTSLSKNDIFEITHTEFDTYFNNLISIASKTDIDGVVCSPNELERLKNFNKLKVVPGIRNDISDDDQKRVMSSVDAYKKGADFIVVGRPITKSEDPKKAMELFL